MSFWNAKEKHCCDSNYHESNFKKLLDKSYDICFKRRVNYHGTSWSIWDASPLLFQYIHYLSEGNKIFHLKNYYQIKLCPNRNWTGFQRCTIGVLHKFERSCFFSGQGIDWHRPDKITKKRCSVKIPQWDRLGGFFDQFEVKFNTRSILSASSSNKVCFTIFIFQHSFGFIFGMRVYILILKKNNFGKKEDALGQPC